jgi:hypothetical protein
MRVSKSSRKSGHVARMAVMKMLAKIGKENDVM